MILLEQRSKNNHDINLWVKPDRLELAISHRLYKLSQETSQGSTENYIEHKLP